jgi:plasmid maintenance system antidote protein VapI
LKVCETSVLVVSASLYLVMETTTLKYWRNVVKPEPKRPGQALAEILREHKLSRMDLAQHLKVEHAVVSALVSGEIPITLYWSTKLRQVFGEHGLWQLQDAHDTWRWDNEPSLAQIKNGDS